MKLGLRVADRLRMRACVVDLAACVIARDGRRTALTEHEVGLLRFLAERAGRPVAREELLSEVWGYSPKVRSRAVDQTVKRLRPKLERDPRAPEHLITVKGVGYRLDLPTAPEPSPVLLPVDAFVGREEAIARVCGRLATGARWVTLTGPGGMGKTRLALEVARREAEAGRSVVVCELADARDVEGLVGRIAAEVGAPAGVADAAALARAGRQLGGVLLVLDNLEQVSEGARRVGEALLAGAPDLVVLATSRARLGLRGEQVHTVGPLPDTDALALLLLRARAVRDDAAWTADDPDVHAIVAALDGHPLALELAAARVALLRPGQLVERLDRPLDVLRGGPPGRHETLRHAIATSWALLDAPGQRALARLSVFRGGFSVEAAEGVIGGDHPLDALQSLVDCSLVQRGDSRMSLLGSIGQFATEALGEGPDRTDAVRAHARVLLQLAESHDVDDPTGWTVIGPLDREHDNLLAVFERQADVGVEGSARALLAALGPLRRRLPAAAVSEHLDVALGWSLPDAVRARLLLARAALDPEPARARARMAEALDLSTDVDARVRASLSLGRSLSRWGRPDDALAVLEPLVELKHDHGIEVGTQLAIAWARSGDWPRARHHLEALAARLAPADAVRPLYALGFAALEFGHMEVADGAFTRVMEVAPEKRDLFVGLRAIVALERSELDVAEPWIRESLAHSRATGVPGYQGEDVEMLGVVAHLRGDLDAAEEHYSDAQELFRRGGQRSRIARAWGLRAIVFHQRGQDVAARRAQAEVEAWADAVDGIDMRLVANAVRVALDGGGPAPVGPGGRCTMTARWVLRVAGLEAPPPA